MNKLTLPDNWIEVELGQINHASTKNIDPASSPDEIFELYSVPSFPSGKPEIIQGKEIGSTKQTVEPDDVLVCKINPRINRVWVVKEKSKHRQIASSEWIVVRNSYLESRFLKYFFTSQDFRDELCADVTGVGGSLTRAQPKRVAQICVPIAPRNEQKRIADKLDQLLAAVDSCKTRLDTIPGIVKRFRQSVLAAATSGELTVDWRKENQSDETGLKLLDKIRSEHRVWWEKQQVESMQKSGKRPQNDNWKKNYKAPEPVNEIPSIELPSTWAWGSGAEIVSPGAEIVYGIVQPGPKLDEGVPYVRGMDIVNGQILVNQLMKTSRDIADRYSRSSLQGGDVLLGIIRATKVAVVPEVIAGANITQGTARYRPSSVITTDYLAIALEAPATQSWLHEHYRGIDMPGLNLADVRLVPIPLPPLSEQAEIAYQANRLLSLAEQIEEKYNFACERVERLTPSILAKAFRGGLVPQEPNDEPAEKLLERIQSAQTKSSTAKTGKRQPKLPNHK